MRLEDFSSQIEQAAAKLAVSQVVDFHTARMKLRLGRQHVL